MITVSVDEEICEVAASGFGKGSLCNEVESGSKRGKESVRTFCAVDWCDLPWFGW